MDKPKYLYHGSTQQGSELLEPREDPQNTQLVGKFVFATQYKTIAAMYLSPIGFPTTISRFGDEFTIAVQADFASYSHADAGGSIYTLLPDGFISDPEVGMQESEWHTATPVRPRSEEHFATGREAMHATGAKLYLVDAATYESIQRASDHGLEIIHSLTPLT